MGAIKIEKVEEKSVKNMLDLIYTQNEYIIKKMNEISKSEKTSNRIEEIKNTLDISSEIHDSFKEKKLTYKQYYVLKYHLANPYVSDTYLSGKTGVSYSSISQWKNKDMLFRMMYDKIKSAK